MVGYEIQKVFSRPFGKIALVLLALLVLAVSVIAIQSVEYVDPEGNSSSGLSAAKKLRAAKSPWSGYLTEDVFAKVIQQNREINATPEARSTDIQENNRAYAKKQGFSDIREIINCALCSFREYDYYRADTATEADAAQIYQMRVRTLEEWLSSDEAINLYSDTQKAFFLKQYRSLETPLRYEDADGWDALLNYSQSVIMVTMLILGFLVCEIFSCEYQWKADSVFFSSRKGRTSGTRAKICAGVFIVTLVYWAVLLSYTGIVLGTLGAGGADTPIQASLHGWKSFYNITWLEEYLLTAFGGYIGTLFILTASMLVSAVTKSPLLANGLPVVVLFLPTFLGSLKSVSGVLGLLPDQLLQVSYAVRYFNAYEIAGIVVGALPILVVVYGALTAALVPVLYGVYRRADAG